MLEKNIRQLGIEYLNSVNAFELSTQEVQKTVENRFSTDYLITMICSIIFYHMKRESFWNFVLNNRHELLPDKLSSMVQDEHTVLLYLTSKGTGYAHKDNSTYKKLTCLLITIKRDLIVDKNEFLGNNELNLEKGKLTEDSRIKLNKEASKLYSELIEEVSKKVF